MKFSAENKKLSDIKADYFIVAVFKDQKLSPSGQKIDKALKGLITQCLKSGDHRGELGEILPVITQNESYPKLILVGAGQEEPLTDYNFLKIASTLATSLKRHQGKKICNTLAELAMRDRNPNWRIRQMVMAVEDATYQFNDCKSEKPKKQTQSSMIFYLSQSKMVGTAELAIQEATAISQGMGLAKTLGNLPANICTPSYMAKEAKKLEKKYKKIKCKVLTETDMKKLGMGALLSVSAGSSEPARLIVLEYRGNRANRPPVALVGKGITFDTGGISLKPPPGMDEMKFDMCGAASVMGTIQAAAEIGLPINLVAILACSENCPGNKATKPGDIVTTMAGDTVEILNTDAEGRLVLCDALTYAAKFKPDTVIDVATLTGAMVISVGPHASGVMANDDFLADEIKKAGDDIYDRVVHFPIWHEYNESLESNFADVANVGARPAGSIIAACFLARFTKQYRWAHLDIAGCAWLSGKNKGSTGRPVPLLMQYLLNRCNK